MAQYDVIVIGAGNAALAASVSARGAGAEHVLVLEKAPEHDRGGNTHFSGGLFRFAFNQPGDLLRLVPKAREVEGFMEGIEAYPTDAFREDLARVTDGRTDPELSQILIANSYETVCWMAEQGIAFELALSLSGVRVGNVIKWPKGAIVRAAHEGVGLSRMWFNIARRAGVEIRYSSPVQRLVQDRKGRVSGVLVRDADGIREISAGAVVLGCGGFEANMAWRAQYLGRPWDHARVRGTRTTRATDCAWRWRLARCRGASGADAMRRRSTPRPRLRRPRAYRQNQSPLLRLRRDAQQAGPAFRRRGRGPEPLHLRQVRRHHPEPARRGRLADFRQQDHPVARAALLNQPADYRRHARRHRCRARLDRAAATRTLAEYNAAAGNGSFNPGVRDGMHTEGLALRKSNWAQKLDAPPYYAYPVTGGITFSFGGVKVNDHAQVIGTDWDPIPGLFACGEMVGGLFHNNYPGGSGLMSGAVFGRIAGRSASAAARAASQW